VTTGTGEDSVEHEGSLENEEDVDNFNRVKGGMARAVLEYLAKSIVDDPDAVVIELEERRRGDVRLALHVSADDMGKVIGRRGRVAQAIRTVVRAAGAREDVDVSVDIVD
jgi:predicted RNA-binding protein YlqC (UPF0109 family)